MKKSDFHVKVEDGILNISFEHKYEKEEKEKNYTRKEFGFKSFVRSFTLPENAKQEDIKAQYEDGILKLHVAKKVTTPVKVKEIAIV
jgi:HSP20 family protein